ncbi:T9SS type A sorting domain-containing protein [uncultured Microscilla sp.]|uniref:T9SS type A sorting domain-containing protein n=1 Tax=uncultured Microscilla sp. TaxID=432653 RepID=UPI002634BCD5|nr:T9SS type A sorting domain-containing protein [uncultured Microscilla sp.]
MKKFTTLFAMTLLFMVAFANNVSAQCSVSGTSSMLAGETRIYTATNQSGAKYFWSTTGGLSIVGSNTGRTVSVRGTSNGTLYYARYKSGTAPCTAARSVSVSVPGCPTAVAISQLSAECIGRRAIIDMRATLTGSGSSPVTYQWTVISGAANIINNNSAFATAIANSRASFTARVTVTCNGQSITATRIIRAPYCNGSIDPLRISPNPSNADLTVEIKSANKIKVTDAKYQVEVVNKNGKVVLSENLKSAKQQFNTSKLPKGMYYIRTKLNGKELGTSRWIKR